LRSSDPSSVGASCPITDGGETHRCDPEELVPHGVDPSRDMRIVLVKRVALEASFERVRGSPRAY